MTLDNAKLLLALKATRRKANIRARFGLHFTAAGTELLYQSMLVNALQYYKVGPLALYPTGSASNYSLLYTILRVITETPAVRVLELGAGQTTLLLDGLRRSGRDISVDTIETDPYWADKIASKVSHPVHHSALASTREAYADLGCIKGKKYDFLIVDGPVGRSRNSRASSLDIMAQFLDDQFVVIFDDAERKGEQDTIQRWLATDPRPRDFNIISGTKSQLLLFTEDFRGAKYF